MDPVGEDWASGADPDGGIGEGDGGGGCEGGGIRASQPPRNRIQNVSARSESGTRP